jgi:hypothetical protein
VQPLRQVAEQGWRDREIESLYRIGPHLVAQIGPASLALGIHRQVVEPLQERRDICRIALRFGDEFLQRLPDPGCPVLCRLLRARRPDDPRLGRHLAVAKAPEQRRQDLPPGQIARAAEDNEVEGIDRYDTRNHDPVSANSC